MNSLFLPKNSLPSGKELSKVAEKFRAVLESEESFYRIKNSDSKPGSLLDFSSDNLPIIVVPDLHARPYFIKNILEYTINADSGFLNTDNNETVLSALEKGLLRIVCVGDALHSEKTTASRWYTAMEEFLSRKYTGTAMKEEMTEGLSLLLQVMNLKIAFPEHFHFLKGNHENIKNENGNGDYSFRKYAREGQMVKEFMMECYGNEILDLISNCEHLLPLVFIAPNCIVSHAEPYRVYTSEEIINARLFDDVVEGLTWTGNGDAEEGSVLGMIETLLPKSQSENVVYLAGHRPVEGNYKLWQGGKFIQIHNPLKQNIALVRTDRKFDPEKDIIGVEK